jgi:hypothetical protein
MEHDLKLARILVHTICQTANFGVTVEWKNTRMLEMEKLGVQPDAWVSLTRNNKSKQAYIEFTSALPTKEEWKRKINGYELILDSTTPILWFTTSNQKINSIQKAVINSPIGSNVLVGLIENVGQFVTGKVWWSGESQVQWLNLGGVATSTPSPSRRVTLNPFLGDSG